MKMKLNAPLNHQMFSFINCWEREKHMRKLSKMQKLSLKRIKKLKRDSVTLTVCPITGMILLRSENDSDNIERFNRKVIYNNIKERNDTINEIDNLLKRNDWWEIDIEAADRFMKIIENKDYKQTHRFEGKSLAISLVLNAANQFCFWVDPNNQKFRALASSSYFEVTLDNLMSISDRGMTLRKERMDINSELLGLYDFALRHQFSWLDYVEAATDSKVYNTDYFRKKKNLLWMLFVRFFSGNKIGLDISTEFINSINPAIDYQIPRLLRGLGIIKCLNPMVKVEGTIEKDSIDEIMLRAVCYKTLIMIQEKYGYNQVELDYALWENRNKLCEDVEHHCTLTTDY